VREVASTSKGEPPAPRAKGWLRGRMLASLFTLGVVGRALARTLVLSLARCPLRKERVIRALLLKASNEIPERRRLIHVCD
jgi:hypothetical protein